MVGWKRMEAEGMIGGELSSEYIIYSRYRQKELLVGSTWGIKTKRIEDECQVCFGDQKGWRSH